MMGQQQTTCIGTSDNRMFQTGISIRGIPTIGPKGIQFRSRLEAQWAYIFEDFGWKWEYEPIDLKCYVPDFIIDFPDIGTSTNQNDSHQNGAHRIQILVEVKHETSIPDNASDLSHWQIHVDKITESGWVGYYIILGASYRESQSDGIVIGCGGYTCNRPLDDKTEQFVFLLRKYKNVWRLERERLSPQQVDSIEGQKSDENHSDGCCDLDIFEAFEEIWVKAKNNVQWKKPQTRYPEERKCLL